MLPTLNFYGNHALNFSNNDIETLEHHTISELRKIPIPDDMYLIEYDALRKQFPGNDLSKFTKSDDWCPISFPGVPDKRIYTKDHIVSLGPMGMRMVFTPYHIILPSVIYERIDWYSPANREKVQAIRSYYHAVINHFGGDHALYVDERITKKHNFPVPEKGKSALNYFEQALITRYGTSKKTLFDYTHGKYPKYCIDNFPDLK